MWNIAKIVGFDDVGLERNPGDTMSFERQILLAHVLLYIFSYASADFNLPYLMSPNALSMYNCVSGQNMDFTSQCLRFDLRLYSNHFCDFG